MKYLTKEEMKSDRYDQAMADYSAGRLVKSRFAIDLVEHYYPGDRSGLAVLDLATAGGVFAEQLKTAGFGRISATDIGDFRQPAGREAIHDFKTADLSLQPLPWPDASFDAAAAWCLLPHLENPHNLLREVRRVLKPGGLFFVSMPNIFSFKHRWTFFRHGDLPRYKSKNNHISAFPKGVFEKSFLKYFDLAGKDYFLRRDAAFFRSATWVEKLLLLGWPLFRHIKNAKELVGYNVVYVLREK